MQVLNEDDTNLAVLEMNAKVEDPQLQALVTSIDVRSPLIADWIEYPPGRTRWQVQRCSLFTIDFDFVLDPAAPTLRQGTRMDKVATT
jgi:hypothetical protein